MYMFIPIQLCVYKYPLAFNRSRDTKYKFERKILYDINQQQNKTSKI